MTTIEQSERKTNAKATTFGCEPLVLTDCHQKHHMVFSAQQAKVSFHRSW